LDYHEFASITVHKNWAEFLKNELPEPQHLFALTTKGSGKFHESQFQANDYFVFGSETKGITDEVRNSIPTNNQLRLAMKDNSRSLNLSNTVAIVVYEAWRQNGFTGGK
jgi:tRNA (cytidine/uridine-2'-O-)-methyltransferase